MRTTHLILASMLAALPAVAAGATTEAPKSTHPGYVDGAIFRDLVDDDGDIVEVDLDKTMLRALGKRKDEDNPGKELLSTLEAVHAVNGTVKAPAARVFEIIKQTQQKLLSAGWHQVTKIKDESDWVYVLTHVTGDQVDGLVALIFESEDREITFVNLVGPIDLSKLGEYGDMVHVPGLENVPGAR
jgi:hypothetical protein